MRRIYLESLVGLILLFMLSLIGYEVVIYQWNTDYDYVLQEHRADAYLDMVNKISDNQGKEAALQSVNDYVDKTRQILTIIPIGEEPDIIRQNMTDHPNKRWYFDDDRVFWFTINNSNDIYNVDVNVDAPLIQKIDFADNIVWLFFLLGFALYCVLLIWFIGRRIRALEKVTLEFANGDLTARSSEKGSTKVGSLNQSFNHMADKISALIISNRALTSAVAHELRTPIFRVQWQAEVLADTSLKTEQQASVASIIEDTEEMEGMVNELLYYARLERPDMELNLESLQLNDWLSVQTQRWKKETSHDIFFEQTEKDYLVEVDVHLLKRALDNLVRNAYRFANNCILITITTDMQVLHISVHDDGHGVEEEYWPYLFNAFYSADPTRNKKQSGHGLGLAIVKQIAERHKAKVNVEHSYKGGACFRFSLPIYHIEQPEATIEKQ